MKKLRRVGMAAAVATVAAGLPMAAGSAAPASPQTIQGTVSGPDGAIAGATVAVTGSSGRFATLTDASGVYSLIVEAGTGYRVAAQAPGFAVAAQTTAISAATTLNLTLTGSGSKFESLPVFGGQIAEVIAGASTGEFYAVTSVIPQLFRTLDYGGTWAPVTVGNDDVAGIDARQNVCGAGFSATGGDAGEVAALVGNKAYVSADFGVTFSTISLPNGVNAQCGQSSLFWGDAAGTSVLLAKIGNQTYVADTTATSPAFVDMTTDYVASTNDVVAVANATDGPMVAVLAAGDVTVRLLTASATAPGAVTVVPSGIGGAAGLVFGGASSATGIPSALFVGNAAGDIEAFAADGGSDSYNGPAAGSVAGCQFTGVGRMPRSASVTDAMATFGQNCFVRTDFTTVAGSQTSAAGAFDAEYAVSGANRVVIAPQGDRGVVKAASTFASTGGGNIAGEPNPPAVGPGNYPNASAGTGPTSGGVAVNGISVPVTKDADLGPLGGSQVATILSTSGGGLSLASTDGGATQVVTVQKGGEAASWSSGSAAGSSWLAYGYTGAGDWLAVRRNWTAATAPISGPNVSVNQAALSEGGFTPDGIYALIGADGTDTVFAGTKANGPTGGTLARISLGGTSGAETAGVAAVTRVAGAVNSLAYCPAGSAASVADVVIAGLGDSGSVVRVASASTATSMAGSPATFTPALTRPVNDVDIECSTGVVWAGTGSNGGGPQGALYKSTDGGVTFQAIGALSGNVTTVAVDPSTAGRVVVGMNSEGFIRESVDGGVTWVLRNDPNNGGKSFMSEGIGDIDLAPAVTLSGFSSAAYVAAAVAVSGGEAVVASGAGVQAAQLGTVPGGGSTPTTRPAQGYALLGADGAVYAYGTSYRGGANSLRRSDFADVAMTPDGNGYWLVTAKGETFAYGSATSYGNAPAGNTIVELMAAPDGLGYWMVSDRGAVFGFGSAQYYGGANALPLVRPVVAGAPTPSGKGYWLFAGDGGVFAYGDAAFYGSAANLPLVKPIVAVTSTSTGRGYWLFAADGGVFAYGDATFYGSAANLPLVRPMEQALVELAGGVAGQLGAEVDGARALHAASCSLQ
jgi:hypothetical protein